LRPAIGFDRSFAVNTSATYDFRGMPGYVLDHHLKGEGKRLALMSELLDPCIADILNRSMLSNQAREHWKLAVATAQFQRDWHGESLQMVEP
jgi:hypothetical protein